MSQSQAIAASRRPASRPAPATSLRAVGVVFFVHGLVFASWTAHIPHVKAALHLSNGGLGLALLGAPIGSVAATLACGHLLARWGSARVVVGALVGYCVLGFGVGEARSPTALFGALVLWGVFQGTLDVSMNTQGITVERALTRPIMSGLHARWSFGAFAGAGLGALGVAVGLSLTAQMLVLGPAAGLVAGGFCTRLMADVDEHPEGVSWSLSGSWRQRTVLILGAIALAAMVCEGAAGDWSAVYLRTTLHSSPGVAGTGYAIFAAAMVIVRLCGDRLLHRYPARSLLPALASMAAIGMTGGLLSGVPAVAMIGLGTLGLGVGLIVPAVYSAAGRLTAIATGQAIAVVSAIGWIGFVSGPPVIGRLAQATSLPLALALLPVLTLAIAAATALSAPFKARPLRDS